MWVFMFMLISWWGRQVKAKFSSFNYLKLHSILSNLHHSPLSFYSSWYPLLSWSYSRSWEEVTCCPYWYSASSLSKYCPGYPHWAVYSVVAALVHRSFGHVSPEWREINNRYQNSCSMYEAHLRIVSLGLKGHCVLWSVSWQPGLLCCACLMWFPFGPQEGYIHLHHYLD